MIYIGGVDLELRFDLAALRRIEREAGDFKNAAKLVETAEGVSLLLWACLASTRPQLSREALDQRLGVADFGRVRAALTESMEQAFEERAFDRPFEEKPDSASG